MYSFGRREASYLLTLGCLGGFRSGEVDIIPVAD